MVDQLDLLGETPAQASLFGEGEDRMAAPCRQLVPDPEKIRAELHAMLALVRDADRLPWPGREARMWQSVFPNMTNWLPPEEGRNFA